MSDQLAAHNDVMLSFTVTASSPRSLARLGRLAAPRRPALPTPTFLAATSRGAIPHLTPDEQTARTAIAGVYVALEDFVEKPSPPVFQAPATPTLSPLHVFTGTPGTTLLALGPRRSPCVPSPVANRDDGFSICTSHGFSRQGVDAYVAAGRALAPDIFVGAADLPGGGGAAGTAVSQKRAEKAARRTGEWTARLLASRPARGTGEAAAGFFAPALFAPIPLLPADRLQLDLAELAAADVLPDGLALYDAEVARALPDGLRGLPRLSLAGSATPRAVLAAVAAGADVVVLQLVNAATDAGVALDFSFPAPSRTAEEGSGPAPLGRDMFDPSGALASSLAPLAPGCGCYACTVHHSAYLRHLLHTKEMLGWTLLQVHNHAVAERFFSGIRDAIARGAFEEEREAFERLYVDALPEVAGAPPRIRGYHLKSEGPNEARKNAPAYSTF